MTFFGWPVLVHQNLCTTYHLNLWISFIRWQLIIHVYDLTHSLPIDHSCLWSHSFTDNWSFMFIISVIRWLPVLIIYESCSHSSAEHWSFMNQDLTPMLTIDHSCIKFSLIRWLLIIHESRSHSFTDHGSEMKYDLTPSLTIDHSWIMISLLRSLLIIHE